MMVETLGSGDLPQTQHLVAELIENLEITRALLAASEAQASTDEWGIFCPDYRPLLVARKQMITMYPRMAEILHLLGSSSLMALPAEADLNGPLAEDIHRYLDTDTATAEERIRLFRLAWDVSCSAFGGRQTLYERYFGGGGDAARNAALLYQIYDRTSARGEHGRRVSVFGVGPVITVAEINIAPVKSEDGAGQPLSTCPWSCEPAGPGRHRRRPPLLPGQQPGRLLSRRQVGKLAQLVTSWDAATGNLKITFPDGRILEGKPELDKPVWTIIWGRRVRARALMGDWMPAISEFCGQPALLMMSDLPCQVFDEFPVSVLSRASVEHLSSRMGLTDDECLATDRFRPTLLLDGCDAHQEDGWMNRTISIGDAVVRILAPDPRCAIVDQDPVTGETDTEAVKSILSYRPNAMAAYFGVYGIVEKPGTLRVGDEVTL